MSLILDALKKLEREKAAQSNKPSDIAAGILEQRPAASSRRPMVFVGAIALIAAVSIAGMYFAFLMNNKPAPLSTAAPLAPVPQPTAAPVAQPAAAPAAQPATAPAPAEKPAPLPAAAEPAKATPAAVKASPIKEKARPEKTKRAEPEKKASAPPAGAAPARPDFTISAIIWYDEPAERKAVIDGKSVREGDIIEGCRVKQIDPSRVIFVKDGKPFEVTMNR